MNFNFTMPALSRFLWGYPVAILETGRLETRMNTGLPGLPGLPGNKTRGAGRGAGRGGEFFRAQFSEVLVPQGDARVLPGAIYRGSIRGHDTARVWSSSIVKSK
jgi:hypothetical protein